LQSCAKREYNNDSRLFSVYVKKTTTLIVGLLVAKHCITLPQLAKNWRRVLYVKALNGRNACVMKADAFVRQSDNNAWENAAEIKTR